MPTGIAWRLLGGTGAHKSSQISTARLTAGSSSRAKSSRQPKGATVPASRTSSPTASRDEENQRSS